MIETAQRKVVITEHLGRIWVGCLHGRSMDASTPALLCLPCLREYIRYREKKSSGAESNR